MASVNKVILIGNAGRDPEGRSMPNGDQVAQLSIATTESWKDKNTGEKKELTEWHRVVFYRRLAEVVLQYVAKGTQLYVEGKLTTRKWTDKDGIERFTTEIVADSMQLLSKAPQAGGDREERPQPRREERPQPMSKRPAPQYHGDDDDIPY